MAGSRDGGNGPVRSGDEPAHARSALRPRLWLAGFGFVDAVAGVVVFALLGSAFFVVVSIVLGVVSGINLLVVARHIRQGPHYQPGRTIPPYRPVEDGGFTPPRPPRTPATARTRHRRYFLMMGTCLLLIVLAWTWVHLYSILAAGVMTVVAALIPPFAAIITNADSPILRGEGQGGEGDGDGAGTGAGADYQEDDDRKDGESDL